MIVDGMDMAWCPGCGNFSIRAIISRAVRELGLDEDKVVFASGIGQAAKMPHYLDFSYFNGLHGRAIPAAFAIKASNPGLTVFAEGGDGDMYGEGGNHFIHNIRRNPDIVHIVHNNMVYGLTKGQASPTSELGFVTPVQVNGVILEPFDPAAVAVAMNASFVARAFALDADKSTEILKKAILHKGYSLIDMLHSCVSFNKINTNKWFKDNTYYVGDDYDPTDRNLAFDISTRKGKIPLGIIYVNNRATYGDQLNIYKNNDKPLYKRESKGSRLHDEICG
jgi:2-oxoglutarate/2-oxoacid ferredoxin oxidoreductase subunit beta